MKAFQPKATSESAGQSAAESEQQRPSLTAQPFDGSPRQQTQHQVLTRLTATSNLPVQLGRRKGGGQGSGKKDEDKPKVSAAEVRRRRQEGSDARRSATSRAYSADTVKYQEKHLSATEVSEVNKTMRGHASGSAGNGQNAGTSQSLAAIKKETAKTIAEKKQQERQRKSPDVESQDAAREAKGARDAKTAAAKKLRTQKQQEERERKKREYAARKAAEEKQKKRELQQKRAEDWRKNFGKDEDDRGGAGGGTAIVVGGDE